MTTAEIRKMSVTELDKEISKMKMELKKIKLHTSSQHSKETHKLKEFRKTIAVLSTVRTELLSKQQ